MLFAFAQALWNQLFLKSPIWRIRFLIVLIGFFHPKYPSTKSTTTRFLPSQTKVAMSLTTVMKRTRKLLQDGSKTLCRVLGLNLIISLLVFLHHKTVGKGYTEQTKVAVQKSRTVALLRAMIHIVPVGVAMWEIVLNWNTYFVGYAMYNQAYYQFGAKAHEISMEASLSAIVFSYMRYELMLGGGIPFGALFSGLQVSQASYLWSMELWGTISSRAISLKSRSRLLVVVAASVSLAAVAGPSSAILLVPRLDYWPGGSTNFWINVTSDSLWPSLLGNPFLALVLTHVILVLIILLGLMLLMCRSNA